MTNVNRTIKVRFPPSPTGEVHIGNVRTLLFNFFFARKNNGVIVFRFEDTDQERSKREYEEPMLKALSNLGLSWDEGPYRQTDRYSIYQKYIKKLIDVNLAYEAEENKKDGTRVVRLRNHERDVVWNDLVKGEIKINTHTFKARDEEGNFSEDGNPDIIIARNVLDPIYHFTVVIDDWLMGITHVIRGDDHITSTPRQIMILEALANLQKEENEPEVIIPKYAHLPTILGDDGKKLSKRKGNTSLQKFFDLGYLKETMVNYLAFLGWNPGGEREFFSLKELINEFSLEKVQVSPAQFDYKKLDYFNSHYLRQLNDEDFWNQVVNAFPVEYRDRILLDINKSKKISKLILRERISKFSEAFELAQAGEFNIYFDFSYDEEFNKLGREKVEQMICFKGQTTDEAKNNLKLVLEKLGGKSEQWNVESLKNLLWDWSATIGRGQVLHPLRTILSLKDKSPDPFTIMEIIGKEETVRRLNNILN